MYAMPVIKTANDRAALRKAATSGASCYFLGTDSAPHPFARKVAINSVPGIFNAPVALSTYAKVFEEEGALDKLEAFASLNGPKHYRLPPNEDKIVLEKSSWTAPIEVKVAGPDERTLLYRGGETIEWKVVG
jgi:dihydroorotase